MTSRLRALLELTRPANVVTAFADVLAGIAAAGAADALFRGDQAIGASAASLLVATAGLYAGGVVLNDVFDARLDAVERPERPIPSGRVTRTEAAVFGAGLLAAGVAAAGVAGRASLLVAALIAACALLYDRFGKHHAVFGPINMGACRGGNLLLGASVAPPLLLDLWFIALIPVAYIGAVTAISRGEVHGGSRSAAVFAVVLITGVAGALVLLGVRLDYRMLRSLPFLAAFVALVYPPFVRATLHPSPERVRTAVKAGVLALVAMDATLAAGFGGWTAGLVVLGLLPVSIGIARLFAVT
jgi:4-hydroxybenzoate polyprenyltransferase